MEEEGLLYDPRLWVAVAFVLFMALAYKKIVTLLFNTLDARTAKIKSELEEAKRVREEAGNLLAEYKRKQAHYLKEAENILLSARQDAEELSRQAEEELKNTLDERTKQAVSKIALEEEKAVQEVRSHVVDIALAAARAIIVDYVGTLPQDELVKLALSDIEQKIH